MTDQLQKGFGACGCKVVFKELQYIKIIHVMCYCEIHWLSSAKEWITSEQT